MNDQLWLLREFGARRMDDYGAPPEIMSGQYVPEDQDATDPSPTVDLDYELPRTRWLPLDVLGVSVPHGWPLRPRRFIDGKDVGRTIAWMRAANGQPVPIRLSQVGAIALRDCDGSLRRERLEFTRVVSMMTDLFPWDAVESFATGLKADGFRLLRARQPGPAENPFDFSALRKTTNKRTTNEMLSLEKAVTRIGEWVPTLVDGRLETKMGSFSADEAVYGVVKSHSQSNYLDEVGWRVFYDLSFGQRTPAFKLLRIDDDQTVTEADQSPPKRRLSVVTWYLRLSSSSIDSPERGVVRVEVPLGWFDGVNGTEWAFIDRLSRLLVSMRTRDEEYGRAAVTIAPILRAEEALGSVFIDDRTLTSRFYRLAGI
jgi:hypothetical protein